MRPFLYDAPILPKGFRLPKSYLSIFTDDALPDILPWSFLALDLGASLSYYGSMLQKFPHSPLIPFAIINDQSGLYNEEWVVLACFDGNDRSGNPRVWIFDYSAPNRTLWDFTHANFVEWLKDAEEESTRYKADRAEAGDEET